MQIWELQVSNRVSEKTEFGPGKTALYYNNKGLFSDPFLEDRLPNIEKYATSPSSRYLNDFWNIDESESAKFNEAFQRVMDLWVDLDKDIPKFCKKERQLQNTWIDKIFGFLGWTYELEETSSKNGVTNFPDYALFASKEDWKKSKDLEGNNKFKRATAVADAKDWGVSLDGKGFSNKNPSFQIINYLKQTDKSWGILTDGKYWRIYSLRSDSKHATFYEVDLEKILATGDQQRFKYFYNFFRVEAFVVDAKLNDRSFLDFVFEDGKFYSQLVEKNLQERVYKVANSICQGVLANCSNPSEKDLKQIYENSMYYLFKLMFVLNCESKGLLEVNKQDDYYEFSLRKRCFEIKEQLEQGKNWSSQPKSYNYINDLFNLLKVGDQKIGVHGFGKEPFEIGNLIFYSKNKIGDDYLNDALIELACERDDEGNLQFIDYKILSPDHIGSLFEGLLEFKLVKSGKKYDLVNTDGERHKTGSYYTPEFIVDDMVEELLNSAAEKLDSNELLKIKVCDPAMGSGHFLLGVLKNIEIKIQAYQNANPDNKSNLKFDSIKKQVLHNCLFGVDINPLAVELAKFSLWIYSAEKGEQLEQLSDQFKLGNSLIEKASDSNLAFSWKNEFSDIFSSGGFDVVIGNPPYIDSETMVNTQPREREIIANSYATSRGNWDLYIPFFELGLKLVKPKGNVGLIVPNKWMTIEYGDALRSFIKAKTEKLIDCTDIKVFEDAGNNPIIWFGNGGSNKKDLSYQKYDSLKSLSKPLKIDKNTLEDNWGIILTQNPKLISKVRNVSKTVEEFYLVESPFTVSEAYEMKSILKDGKFESGKSYKFINTGTIDPFISLWNKKLTTYIKAKYQMPIVSKSDFKKTFPKRFEQMSAEKIIISGMRYFECYLDKSADCIAGKSTVMIRQLNDKKSMEGLLGLLNSKLISYYLKELFKSQGIDGGVSFTPKIVRKIPIIPSLLDNKEFQNLVSKAIKFAESANEGKYIEVFDEINSRVYSAFDLSDSEIKDVENYFKDTGSSAEEDGDAA